MEQKNYETIKNMKNFKHSKRCSECTNVILEMLRKIYGNVKIDYKIDTYTKLEKYENSRFYRELKQILLALEEFRGNKDFVRRKKLPRCDFFVVNPGFIVELDEIQHFTACRKIALSKYPENLELGFNREKWIKLCEKINAHDNNPQYRDEQRAWYDTLRDIIPIIIGLRPTVRFFMNSFHWCSLDPETSSDVEIFKNIIGK